MAHPSQLTELVAPSVVFVAAAIVLVLTIVAFRAAQRTQRRSLMYVTAAFALFFLKQLVVGTALVLESEHHESLEIVAALMDLGVAALLIWPVIR